MLWNDKSQVGRGASRRDADEYNAAFDDLGLELRLDPAEYERLCDIDGEDNRIRAYLQTHHAHLLKVYELDFLCGLIVSARRRQVPMDAALPSGAVS